jgi:hypothetical protein
LVNRTGEEQGTMKGLTNKWKTAQMLQLEKCVVVDYK